MGKASGNRRKARTQRLIERAAARRADRLGRREAIREGLALWRERLVRERMQRRTMAQAAAAGLPITFRSRGSPPIVFRFGEETLDPAGLVFRPATLEAPGAPGGCKPFPTHRDQEDA